MPQEKGSKLKWLALAGLLVSTLVGLIGPINLKQQLVTMYEKPQHTVTVWPCIAANCKAALASCVADSNCRKTLGESLVDTTFAKNSKGY